MERPRRVEADVLVGGLDGGRGYVLDGGHAGAVEARHSAAKVARALAGRVDARVGEVCVALGGVLADAVVEAEVGAGNVVGSAEVEGGVHGRQGVVGAAIDGARAARPVRGCVPATLGPGRVELHEGAGARPRHEVDVDELLLRLGGLLRGGDGAVVLLDVLDGLLQAAVRAADDGGRPLGLESRQTRVAARGRPSRSARGTGPSRGRHGSGRSARGRRARGGWGRAPAAANVLPRGRSAAHATHGHARRVLLPGPRRVVQRGDFPLSRRCAHQRGPLRGEAVEPGPVDALVERGVVAVLEVPRLGYVLLSDPSLLS